MNSLHRRLTCRILVLGLAMAPAPQLLSGQVYTVLHDLNGTSDGAADCGYNPPVQSRDGNVYGTLCSGGVNNAGAVFEITPRGNYRVFTVLTWYMFRAGVTSLLRLYKQGPSSSGWVRWALLQRVVSTFAE